MERLVDSKNRYRTESLFIETHTPHVDLEPLYSLRDYDNKGYPSAYKIYMNSVNEYEAAIKLVGSMRHWNKLCGLQWFMRGNESAGFDGLTSWREHKAAKEEVEMLRLLKEKAYDGNVTAQRVLLDRSTGKSSKLTKVKRDPETLKQVAFNNKIEKLHKSLRK